MTLHNQPPATITATLAQIENGQLTNTFAKVYPDILHVILKSGLDNNTKNTMTTAMTNINSLLLTLNQGVVLTALTALIALITSIAPKTTTPVAAPAPTVPPVDPYAPAK